MSARSAALPSSPGSVVAGCHAGGMEVLASEVAKVPAENLRVARAEFAAVWVVAERHQDEQALRHVTDWYGGGIVVTCRWLATATVRPRSGPWYLARSPVTGRSNRALPELIEAECLAAELQAMQRPVPNWLTKRPGWAESIVATLNWAWRRSGRPPIGIARDAAG